MVSSRVGAAPSMGARMRAVMQKECVALPGSFNGYCGRMVAEAGFKGTYISGAQLTACAGLPDIGLLTLDHFSRVIKEVVTVSDLPLIADADTGFGEAEMVIRTVKEYHAAGAAGLHIEDQVFPKRCGHLDGKELVPTEVFAEKIKRARMAADDVDKDFIICARTDAKGVYGLDEAIKRAAAYVGAGAEMIFPEGLSSREEFKKFADEMKKLPGPAPNGGPFMLANMTEFGKTPHITMEEFEKLGYHCVIFPVSTFRMAMGGVRDLLKTLRETGSTESTLDKMYSRKELYATMDYTPGVEWTYPSASKSKL